MHTLTDIVCVEGKNAIKVTSVLKTKIVVLVNVNYLSQKIRDGQVKSKIIKIIGNTLQRTMTKLNFLFK